MSPLEGDEQVTRRQARETAEAVARRSYGKLVAFLAARTRDVAAAEDALSERLRPRWRTGRGTAARRIRKLAVDGGAAQGDRCGAPAHDPEARPASCRSSPRGSKRPRRRRRRFPTGGWR